MPSLPTAPETVPIARGQREQRRAEESDGCAGSGAMPRAWPGPAPADRHPVVPSGHGMWTVTNRHRTDTALVRDRDRSASAAVAGRDLRGLGGGPPRTPEPRVPGRPGRRATGRPTRSSRGRSRSSRRRCRSSLRRRSNASLVAEDVEVQPDRLRLAEARRHPCRSRSGPGPDRRSRRRRRRRGR